MTKKQPQEAAPQTEIHLWEQRTVLVRDLKPFERNPRKNTKEDYERLKTSILKFGYNTPIKATQDLRIIGGHLRRRVLTDLGIAEIPVWLPTRALTDEEFKEILVRDNLSNGSWDFDMLASDFDLEALVDWGMPESLLVGKDKIEPEERDDDAPPVPKEAFTKLGDIWQLGNHRLLCGDSTRKEDVAALMGGEKADMVFTDPPYGVDYDGGHAEKGKRREKLANDGDANIYLRVLPALFLSSHDHAPIYLWFSDSKSAAVTAAVTAAGYEIRNTLIWNKNVAQFGAIGAQYKSKHEPCLYCFKKGKVPDWFGPNNEVSVWDVKRESKNEFHPTQKPVELPVRAIGNSCRADGVVVDLFGGSGSTMIACEKTNRHCRMMELSPNYCDVIVKRWQDFTGGTATRTRDGATLPEKAKA